MGEAPHPSPLPAGGERENGTGIEANSLSLYIQGEGHADGAMLARFAADLRMGAFALCAGRERAARAILWRLTILKLREANPEFLAGNGFGE